MTERGRTKLDEFRQRMGELERAKKETDKLRQEAIAELLLARKEINRELRQLGYEGVDESRHENIPERAQEHRGVPPAPRLFSRETDAVVRTKRAFAFDGERKCPICEVSGHDLRAHRGQTVHRRFTHEELVTRGLIESEPHSLSG